MQRWRILNTHMLPYFRAGKRTYLRTEWVLHPWKNCVQQQQKAAAGIQHCNSIHIESPHPYGALIRVLCWRQGKFAEYGHDENPNSIYLSSRKWNPTSVFLLVLSLWDGNQSSILHRRDDNPWITISLKHTHSLKHIHTPINQIPSPHTFQFQKPLLLLETKERLLHRS